MSDTRQLLTELLLGRGGIDLAQSLLERDPTAPADPPHPHYVQPGWCVCVGSCIPPIHSMEIFKARERKS